MVDLSGLKDKAQSRVQGFQNRLHSAPSSSYHAPAAADSHAPAAGRSSSTISHNQLQQDRFAQSTVLQYQQAQNRPGPPPRRLVSTGAPAVPALPSRTAASQSGPALPPRNPSTEPYDNDPVPPYSSPSNTFKHFSEYNARDKQELFDMLDQYFERMLGLVTETPRLSSVDKGESVSLPVAVTTRSYPRPTMHGSFAQDLLHSILPWSTSQPAWFLDAQPIPPFLHGRKDMRWAGSMQSIGHNKTIVGCVLFADASIAWYRVDWSALDEPSIRQNRPVTSVKIDGRYRPRPALSSDWSAADLYDASATYGSVASSFAEEAFERARPIGRGECWDMANSALEHAAEHVPHDVPFPSIDRTHGVLLYYASVSHPDDQTWHAQDGYVRAGDIVEWRSVRIREKGMARGSYVTLGDPEHTAVVVSADVPPQPFGRDAHTPLKSIGHVEVVEQTQGAVPSRRFYDLSTMECGEVWIYRPASLRKVVGCDFECDWDYALRQGYSLQ